MLHTKLFKSDNGQAARIPAELAYDDLDVDLQITRVDDVITIFPARARLKDTVAALRNLPKPAEIEQSQPIEMPKRDGD